MPTPDTFGGLTGISCLRPNVCFAVGGPNELWDGTSWSIQSRDPAQGRTEDVAPAPGVHGGLLRSENGGPLGLIGLRRRDGSWQVQSTPSPAGADSIICTASRVR